MKISLKPAMVWLILTTSTLLWMLPLLINRAGPIVDMRLHYQWASAFQQSLGEGFWVPHWNTLSHEGLGDATFSHIHPLFYYLVSLFDLVAQDLWTSIKWVVASAHWFLGFIIFQFCKKWAAPASALVAAIAGQWMPFGGFQLLLLQNYPSLVALPMVALVMGLTPYAKPRLKWIIFSSLAMSGLILSHILMGFMTIICITATMAVIFSKEIIKTKSIDLQKIPSKALIGWLCSLCLALLICSWYILPALLDRRLISPQGWDLGYWLNPTFKWSNNFSFSFTESYREHFGKILTLWLIPLPGIFIGTVYFIWWINNRKSGIDTGQHPWGKFGGYAACAFFFSSALSWPLWYISPTLQQLQFPWRFIGIMSLAAAFLIASPAFRYQKHKKYLTWISLCITCAISLQFMVGTILPGVSEKPNRSWLSGAYGQPEYVPANVPSAWKSAIGKNKPCNAEASVCHPVRNQSHDKEWRFTTKTADAQLLPVFFHPGWRARIDGQNTHLRADAATGLATIDVPAGVHSVQIYWHGTHWQRWGQRISFFVLILLIALFLWPKTRKKFFATPLLSPNT